MIAHPGVRFTDHAVSVPLDHRDPGGETIEVFAREVVASDRVGDDLPWLVFLQGGPGGKSPRPARAESWVGKAVRTHRVLLLDQRGTGRSTPLNANTVGGRPAKELADYLKLFRADSIVADAEILRERVAGGAKWDTLGQSYGGFVTMAYLSAAPQGLRTCYVTGGLPGLTATADDVYARTYPRVAAKNAEFYRDFPQDRAAVRRIADHLRDHDVRLPDGDRLTAERFRLMGDSFGMSYGYAHIHWLLDEAWHGDQLSATFLYEVMAHTGYIDKPLFALQEYCYGQGNGPTGWAAARALEQRPEFAAGADPLLFTGEMMFPWMFEQIAALRPFAGAADILAETDDWTALYDLDRLAANDVPVVAAVYADDMYVDMGLSLETAAAVGNVRTWVTNEHEHDGLRTSGDAVLGHLMEMASGVR
ncbi:alpha/beta fold hydrolase [Actinoplanes sp. LDG1-06]|uniref:Alpha/beta fold hydrolase n=1 Tax=Paractinoplanes ovalisporus TaxID=2810368 RepID=A0ABS2A471_9ACTN|nr:alpha/beta fold hydrolase [Actinoplanes ovalisporus]MBM2614074.1 alpha/beta fold hydrolase [Actinoplanes ovalisporus]